MPIGTAITYTRISVDSDRVTDRASRSLMTWVTSRFWENDSPMSPRSRLPIHLRYCTCSGEPSP